MPTAVQQAFDRDKWARVYAKSHIQNDDGVRLIIYLPTNAPPCEIRLLEVNSLVSDAIAPEPIDFGVDTGTANAHSLWVLDLSPSQYDELRAGRLPLPAGWSLHAEQQLEVRCPNE